LQERLKRSSVYAAAGACVTGLLVLVGWQFDLEVLKRVIPDLVAMNPVTAICFIILGFNLILFYKKIAAGKLIYLIRGLSLAVALVGVSCLIANLFHVNGGIDYALFPAKLKDEVSGLQNRMAPNTAFNFILCGISVFLFTGQTDKNYKTSQYLILLPTLVSLLSIIGYIYGVKSFYGVLTYIPMAVNTSFCFLLISTSLLLLSCDKGLMRDFTGYNVGSVIARKLIPSVIIIPVLLGVLIIYGEIRGFYVVHFGTALFTAFNILIFVYLVRKIQTSVNKADAARTEAEKKLQELNAELELKSASLQALNAELESFSYSVSHDLKAPLRSINGYAQILIEDYSDKLDEEGKHTANVIINNTRKMAQLIDNLLEFSRVGRKELHTLHCDMELIVKNTISEQQEILKTKEYEILVGELYPCDADPQLMKQVWTNLISNALKYSQKKRETGDYHWFL
jgi:signal transduction histidine kinase